MIDLTEFKSKLTEAFQNIETLVMDFFSSKTGEISQEVDSLLPPNEYRDLFLEMKSKAEAILTSERNTLKGE